MSRCCARGWMTGLLMLLAACSDPEPPVEPTAEPAAPVPHVQSRDADAAYYDELRERWFELEHASPQPPESEAGSAPSAPVDPAPPAEAVAESPASSSPSSPLSRPVLAIVIDDVGHNLRQGQRLIALPQPVTLAILPHTQAARQLATEAAAAGQTVMLHQPMENGAGLSIGPGGLYSGMPRAEMQQQLNSNLDSFSPVVGINNHMGSRLTAEREAMDAVMQVLRERGLFFIDSRTTHHTQAAFAAEAAGVPHLSRNVFLDNERSAEAIGRAFDRALELARREGSALVIGHPYAQTLAFLEWRLAGDLWESEGVDIVSVEELLARKYSR